MLAAISDTLLQFSRKDQATPAALALQGLQELCRAEVSLSVPMKRCTLAHMKIHFYFFLKKLHRPQTFEHIM